MQFLKDQSNVFKLQVQSRHISSVSIEYIPHSIGHSGKKILLCANEQRTVGCCSHIAVIIYYLSYGQYLSKISRPAQHLSLLFKTDDITLTNENSDED